MKDSKKRFRAIQEICRNIKECRTKESKKRKGGEQKDDDIYHDGCGAVQPERYTIQDKLTIQVEFQDEQEVGADRKRAMPAEEVLNIFKSISADDCKIMGLDPRKNQSN